MWTSIWNSRWSSMWNLIWDSMWNPTWTSIYGYPYMEIDTWISIFGRFLGEFWSFGCILTFWGDFGFLCDFLNFVCFFLVLYVFVLCLIFVCFLFCVVYFSIFFVEFGNVGGFSFFLIFEILCGVLCNVV